MTSRVRRARGRPNAGSESTPPESPSSVGVGLPRAASPFDTVSPLLQVLQVDQF